MIIAMDVVSSLRQKCLVTVTGCGRPPVNLRLCVNDFFGKSDIGSCGCVRGVKQILSVLCFLCTCYCLICCETLALPLLREQLSLRQVLFAANDIYHCVFDIDAVQ